MCFSSFLSSFLFFFLSSFLNLSLFHFYNKGPPTSFQNWVGSWLSNTLDLKSTIAQYRENSLNSVSSYSSLQKAWTKFQGEMCALENGLVKNWEKMESLLDWLQTVRTFEESTVLFSHSAFESDKSRCKIAEMLFETHHVDSLCLFDASSLALLSSCNTTGVVIDVGAFDTRIVPVYCGSPIKPLCRQMVGLGGMSLKEHFHRLLLSDVSGDASVANRSYLHLGVLEDVWRSKCFVPAGLFFLFDLPFLG